MDTTAFQLTNLAPLSAPADDGNEHYVPEGVCAKQIDYAIEGDKLTNVHFVGGCEGNLKAISYLIEGIEIGEVIDKLSGITCGNKPTSCTDQLCNALREHMDKA